ncbi:MAG TPA: cytochrome b/b6 domain-containing protein [Acidimicrobiales bacterium]|nr:cytochrome b/b6 domain-containing protein [Acidimicrobiales bacterium]
MKPVLLTRFDRTERVVHWANATLFLVLVATGAALYIGPLSAVVGRRELVKTVHVWSGLALPVPLVLGLASPRRGRALRADVGRLNRWLADDRRWFRSLGRDRSVRFDKFHPGQKLNAAFVAGAIPVMLLSGSIMRWYKPFPLAWRTGATFVHDWIAVLLFVAIVGHIGKALSEPEALQGMLGGNVDPDWARRRHPRWHPVAPAAPATPARAGRD